jgi:hypothetical protein
VVGEERGEDTGVRMEATRTLKVWRLHPSSCPIVRAEKTLRGAAHRAGVRWCGPFTNANRAGWWVFPPVDVDIVWKGGSDFEYDVLTPYSDADSHLIRFLLRDDDDVDVDSWLPEEGRTKFSWGLVDEGVVQIWTGCMFETPPGWGLHIRSPINFSPQPFHVMEAVLETDWLRYDVWLNIAFDRKDEVARLRRDDWPPVAQIVPVPRETYEAQWQAEEELVHRKTPEANEAFEFFLQYNQKKFAGHGRDPLSRDDPSLTKDSATYYKERKRILGGSERDGYAGSDSPAV